MNKRLPIYLLLLLLLLAGGLMVKKRWFSLHPFQLLPPYVSEVTIFSIHQTEQLTRLPRPNRPQTKDIDILKQAAKYWIDTNMAFDSLVYYVFDRQNPETTAALAIVRCRQDKENVDRWTAFVEQASRSEHTYRRETVVHYDLAEDLSYYFAMEEGLLLFSSSQRMVERSLALHQEKASSLMATLRRDDLRLKAKDVSCVFYQNTTPSATPQWSGFEWWPGAAADSLAGRASGDNTTFTRRLVAQAPVDFSPFLTILPNRIQLADMISLADRQVFFEDHQPVGPAFWNADLQAVLAGSIAYVRDADGASSFLAAPLSDAEKGKIALQQIADKNGVVESFTHQTFPVVRLLAEDVSAPFFSDRYPLIKNPYCAIVDGVLICGNDRDRMKLWMDYHLVQNNLAGSAGPDPFLFNRKSRRMLLWREPVSNEGGGANEFWRSWTEGHSQGVLRFDKKGRHWSVSGKMKRKGEARTLAEIRWQESFDRPLGGGPFLLKDPLTGRPHSLWVQDEQFRLYVYAVSGKLLWEKKLEGPVLGGIHSFVINPVDWEVLFNTPDVIFKVNPDGEVLASWPLQVAAVEGLALTEFGEPHDPHFFLPAENNAVYGYNILGNALINWNPHLTDRRVASRVFHMASAEADHLFWLDEAGGLQANFRNGETVKISGDPPEFRSLLLSKKNGVTYTIGEDATLGCLTPEMQYSRLSRMKQVQGYRWFRGEKKDYIVLYEPGHIKRWALEGQKATLDRHIPYPNGQYRLDLLENEGHWYTLVADLQKEQLHLLDEEGQIQWPESLPCNGLMEVFEMGGVVCLATVMEDKLVVYEL